ncbi:hypothetical protein BJX66DRAFT_307674 [Aspergillus keveii]|uniref:Uncharacterized protein n=1 Tax=Aspergillus keveii TaxID=714993 RepID=A0ABR4G0K3_9EURO
MSDDKISGFFSSLSFLIMLIILLKRRFMTSVYFSFTIDLRDQYVKCLSIKFYRTTAVWRGLQ